MLSRLAKLAVLSLLPLGLAACGFHLRGNVPLPASMQHVHLQVNGGGDLQRVLARALRNSGVEVEDKSGPDTAELRVPVAAFSTDTLTVGGSAQVTEYAVHYNVQFQVIDAKGDPVVGLQHIQMSREYSYDVTNTIGNASQVEQIQRSLIDDMVQAILFRLQAATKHPQQMRQAQPGVAPARAPAGGLSDMP